MNTRNRNRRTVAEISYQMAEVASAENEIATEDKSKSNVVKTTDFGSVRKSTFSITVKSPDEKDEKGERKVLYTNDTEDFEYDFVDGFTQMLLHAGAKISDDGLEFLSSALVVKDENDVETADSKATAEATSSIVSMYNSKQKADAKSSAYQALVNKYTPLEGQKKESAQARLIANFIKLAGVSKEMAITQLKAAKAIPEDYTVADFDSTPLRRTGKNEDDE